MTITLTREEAQQVLDALEKLANKTPTTHVRIGKAVLEGKEHVALWFDDSTDPLQQAQYLNATKPEKLKPLLSFFRARLSALEPPCKTGSQCIGGKCPQCVVSEPVAWMNESDMGKTDWKVWAHGKPTATMPLYAAPPKPEPSVKPVAWHEPGAYGNVTVYQKWAEENGWLPLYAAPLQQNV